MDAGCVGRERSQTRELGRWIVTRPQECPLVRVTHQVILTAKTGVFPASGELVVMRIDKKGEATVAGRIWRRRERCFGPRTQARA